ncbi:hypothetical protein A9Q02_19110 [Candidatus Chloroploca asiatica]|uniref:Uncharacterized protein n=1 Tax=Candidatus Chloroploca asiatica TaxID=1506545 RepID=A0A2H3KTH2_9CHLR|nr:hypothetical protein A9Q02_19110 [Candidatus Chloroploca asiatica]
MNDLRYPSLMHASQVLMGPLFTDKGTFVAQFHRTLILEGIFKTHSASWLHCRGIVEMAFIMPELLTAN